MFRHAAVALALYPFDIGVDMLWCAEACFSVTDLGVNDHH